MTKAVPQSAVRCQRHAARGRPSEGKPCWNLHRLLNGHSWVKLEEYAAYRARHVEHHKQLLQAGSTTTSATTTATTAATTATTAATTISTSTAAATTASAPSASVLPPPPSSCAQGHPFSVRATSCLDTSLRKEEEGATSPLVAATRADDGRDGTGRSPPPLRAQGGGFFARRPTGTEDGQCSCSAAGEAYRIPSRRGGQSRSVTWLPQCRRWLLQLWRPRRPRLWTPAPSPFSWAVRWRCRERRRRRRERWRGRRRQRRCLLKENAVKLVQEMQALDAKISAHLPVSKEEWKLWRSWSQSRPQPSSSSSSGAKRKSKKKRRKRKRRPPPPVSRRT